MKQPDPLLISLSQLAQRLGIGTRTLQRMEREGELPPRTRIGNRKMVMFRYADILAWIEKNTVKKEEERHKKEEVAEVLLRLANGCG